jgi:D-glycero-D-manno-heptose 1,7-bisphosphate phosphatase
MEANRRRHILLERDGVVHLRVLGRCASWNQFPFLPHALDALRLLAECAYNALVVSSQACVGKGLLSSKDLEEPPPRGQDFCNGRKAWPGLILRARIEHRFAPEETFLVEDSPNNLRAADAAGCWSILIRREAFLEERGAREEPPIVACNLYEAAGLTLAARDMHQREAALLPQ